MKTKNFFLAVITFLAAFPATLEAYTERNLLQGKITREQISDYLVTQQKWVDYPSYADREGWDKLLGKNKETVIRNGEKQLKHEWKVITATDYLEFERSGNRKNHRSMQTTMPSYNCCWQNWQKEKDASPTS